MYVLKNLLTDESKEYKTYELLSEELCISVYTTRRLFMYSQGKIKMPRDSIVTKDIFKTYVITKVPKVIVINPEIVEIVDVNIPTDLDIIPLRIDDLTLSDEDDILVR